MEQKRRAHTLWSGQEPRAGKLVRVSRLLFFAYIYFYDDCIKTLIIFHYIDFSAGLKSVRVASTCWNFFVSLVRFWYSLAAILHKKERQKSESFLYQTQEAMHEAVSKYSEQFE